MRKEWLWECSLTRLLCALSKAQGFLISRLSCPVISPGGKRASFSWTDPCGEQVISDGGLLLYSKASEIPRCWGRMQIRGHAFLAPQFILWPLAAMGFYLLTECVVSCRHGRLSFHSRNSKRVSLWEQQFILSECYYSLGGISVLPPPALPLTFPLHLCLKTGNWNGASKCNLAQRLSLPPNDTWLFFFIEAVLHSLSLN